MGICLLRNTLLEDTESMLQAWSTRINAAASRGHWGVIWKKIYVKLFTLLIAATCVKWNLSCYTMSVHSCYDWIWRVSVTSDVWHELLKMWLWHTGVNCMHSDCSQVFLLLWRRPETIGSWLVWQFWTIHKFSLYLWEKYEKTDATYFLSVWVLLARCFGKEMLP